MLVLVGAHHLGPQHRLVQAELTVELGHRRGRGLEGVAQGPPRQLLREHFAEVLLELPRQDFPASARELPLNLLEAADRIEITTHDLEGTLRALLGAHVPLHNLRIRPANLEDLFLELTGKELRP